MGSSNEYMADYMLQRYHDRRAKGIELLGGKCVKCSSTDDLQFDHIDRDKKTIDISKLLTRGWNRFLEELKLCQLLCDTCHKAKTNVDLKVPVEHGMGKTGKRNCYCDLCGPLKREYMRKNKHKWR